MERFSVNNDFSQKEIEWLQKTWNIWQHRSQSHLEFPILCSTEEKKVIKVSNIEGE